MADSLASVSAVQRSLTLFEDSVTALQATLERIDTNKNNIGKSWQSANASNFITQYGEIYNQLDKAYQSLLNYKGKINHVVEEFVGFDNTAEGNG